MLGQGGSWINGLGGKYVRTTRFEIISSGTSGTVTLPPFSTVVLDDFGGTTDAVISKVVGGRPTYEAAYSALGAVVATTFDSSGNYTLSAAPSAYPVAIIYRVQQTLATLDSTASNIIGGPEIVAALAASIPPGGTAGQIIEKQGSADYDISWVTPPYVTDAEFTAYQELIREPTGFPNRTDSTTSFVDGTRTFTIAPVSGSYKVYIKGHEFTKTTSTNLVIPNTDGNHYIYFDINGTLSSTQSIDSDFFQNNAFVAIVYWNTTNSARTYFAEERHGLIMDGQTHGYLHTVLGARYISGGALQGFNVDNTGNAASHAQFTAALGSIRDEDILLDYPAQTQIPILYRSGTLWRKKAADAYPLIYSGTAGYTGANGRMPYNELVGASWQLTQAGNNNFVLVHIFATNDKDNPVVGIQGVAQYNSVSGARQAANSEIASLSGLPFAEFVALGSVIYETSNTYANVPKSRVRSTDTGGNYVDFRGSQLLSSGTNTASNHSLLSNLTSDDHLQYLTEARGDARYYVKGLTYTQAEVKAVSIVNALIFG